MSTNPPGAAARLDGLADRLASGLLEDIARMEAAAPPSTDIALAQRTRLRGVIARTAVAIRKLQEQEARRPKADASREEDDMNGQDQPDDPETLERKYVELHATIARLAAADDARAAEGGGAAGAARYRPGQPGDPGQSRAA